MDALRPDDPVSVGAYRLVGRIGAGGMGRVYLGVSPGGRKVAVKLIQPDYASTPEFRERFAREVEAARRVGGFHTAQVVDADPFADPPWMVTAYIAGLSLQAAVSDGGPLGPDEIRALGAGLAEGLAAIHACGLVHRDVKPSNVILADDGPRIIDFGIARVVGASTMTASGAVLGTIAYMSPEQVNGESAGPASDVFSLASTLVFAATGHSPFSGDTIAAVVHRIAYEPPDLTGLPGEAGFRELVAECLAKNPADRPSLARILAGLSAAGGGDLRSLRSIRSAPAGTLSVMQNRLASAGLLGPARAIGAGTRPDPAPGYFWATTSVDTPNRRMPGVRSNSRTWAWYVLRKNLGSHGYSSKTGQMNSQLSTVRPTCFT
jgi:serine/threonine protein kinase